MKQKIIHRGLVGCPAGIAIGFLIPLVISACIRDGFYYPVTPELISTMGSELNAVILQTVLCGLLGSGFAMASCIWEVDSWRLATQTGVYFLIACLLMLPIAYLSNWMKHSVAGVLSYVSIFGLVFVVVWIVQYLSWKRRINQMNDCFKTHKGD
ncbi:MAG: DUF3021 domain-containing protein [Gemmiger sp.]